MASVELEGMRDVWIVWKNTDDTEGRGTEYISHTCELEATAKRISKGKYVMGSDCPIEKVKSFKINGRWHQQSPIVPASADDRNAQARINAERGVKGRAEAALKEAEKLGLSAESIAALRRVI
jgi:hypothetical protein